jgi:DNA ligase D
MPADGRAGTVLVDEGHGERVGIDAGPVGNPGPQRQQECWKWPGRCPVVRLAEERHPAPSHDAAHLEIRKRDAGNPLEEGSLIGVRDEVLAILEAQRHITVEEARRPCHDPSVTWQWHQLTRDSMATTLRKKTGDASPTVVGIRISHPDRFIYPDLGISKIQLARYYERIADWIVPHVAGRPLTLVHCPAGIVAPCNFLKHAKAWGPSALRRVRIQEKTKVGEYLVADSIEAVVSLAQMGIVEIHTWNSMTDDIERPNRLVWDLDPGPDVSWTQVTRAAELVRDVLKALKLTSWVKTTGGRGLHVVVPLKPKRSVAECLEFSRAVSDAIASADPRAYTTAFAKSGREAKILIDYLRNNRTNTSVCAFSPRARPGATVSMPLAWNELRERPERWTILTVPGRLARIRTDPWADYWDGAQTISAASFAAVARVSSSGLVSTLMREARRVGPRRR